VIIHENVRAKMVAPEKFIFRELDNIKPKGKNEPVKIFEVMQFTEANKETVQEAVKHFERGLMLYRKRFWNEAKEQFVKVLTLRPEDGPTDVFLERIEEYEHMEMPEDWDGVKVMTHK